MYIVKAGKIKRNYKLLFLILSVIEYTLNNQADIAIFLPTSDRILDHIIIQKRLTFQIIENGDIGKNITSNVRETHLAMWNSD